MKKPGIIGGIAPESTIQYYRLIISGYRDRVKDGSYPPIFIDSIDMKRMLDLVGAGDMPGLVDYLAVEIESLKRAGADFCLLASNTPHIAFEALRSRASLPLISIVEATAATARNLGLKRVGLFGTAFTMQGRFYPDVLSRAGITIKVPTAGQQEYIHDKYMNELVNGIFLPQTRDRLLEIADELRKNEEIEGLILGGTELPLILDDAAGLAIPFLDTTRIHVESAITHMLS